MTGFLDYIHEFHPYDALFLVPVAISAWLFWKHRTGKFTFFETLFGSAIASSFVTLLIMAVMTGPWALIGITAGLILMIYLPVCLVVGLTTVTAAKAVARKSIA
jgi:hypothetical protein